MYLASEKVDVFPTTKRGAQGKLLSERRMTEFVTATADNDSFIVVPEDKFAEIRDYDLTEWDGIDFSFYVGGYHFTLTDATILMDSFDGEDCYAFVLIDVQNPQYPELSGQDEDGVYKGLVLSSNPDEISSTDYQRMARLQLLKKGMVPFNAFHHARSISIQNIDGGVLE